jgi:hypothetical protein
MSEFTGEQEPQQQTYERIHAWIGERARWIQEAAAAINGPMAVVEYAFDKPPEVRDHAPVPDWTEDQIVQVRAVARRLGYGAIENVPSEVVGGQRLIEGGKAWKMDAEVNAIEDEIDPSGYVICATPFRELGIDEKNYLGADAKGLSTEYDYGRAIAERLAAVKSESVLPFGYEVAQGNKTIQEATGQLIRKGQTESNQTVDLLRVDREVTGTDRKGRQQYRYQPDTTALMGFQADVLKLQGDITSPVAQETSGTYAERVVDVVRAGLAHRRQFGVGLYGRKELLQLNANLPAEMPLNQIAGSLRSYYEKLRTAVVELDLYYQAEKGSYPYIDYPDRKQYLHMYDPGVYIPFGPG